MPSSWTASQVDNKCFTVSTPESTHSGQSGWIRFCLLLSFGLLPPCRQCSPSPAPTLTASRTSFCPRGWDVGRWGENLLSCSNFLSWSTWMPCFSIWFYICTSTWKLIFKISSANVNPSARSLVKNSLGFWPPNLAWLLKAVPLLAASFLSLYRLLRSRMHGSS